MSVDGIVSKEWLNRAVPDAQPVRTMLIEAERQLLYYLTSQYFTDSGNVIDAGCFLGGSTTALGLGLRQWQSRTGRIASHRIHSYDLFEVEPWTIGNHLQERYRPGDSFRPQFEEVIQPVREFVTIHEGDITEEPPPDGPIEILFIDVAKTRRVSDFLVRRYFPKLIPGQSIVVQQDYLFEEFNGWLHITMEVYRDYFRMLTDTGSNSVAFLYERPIPPEKLLIETVGGMSAQEKVRLLNQARTRFSGEQADVLQRAEWNYILGKDWTGPDRAAHAAAREVAGEAQAQAERIRRLEREMAEGKKQIAQLETRLKEMEGSTSWRVTAGLRAAGNALSAAGLRGSRTSDEA